MTTASILEGRVEDLLRRAPFPWFGGKREVAAAVWERFGDVTNYVDPFAGSLAVPLARPHKPGIETLNDADGFLCLGPDVRILRRDLSWARASQIREGDQLVGFDESNGAPRVGLRAPLRYRHWKTATVTSVRGVIKPCYALTFDDGTEVVASADHLWLAGSHASGGRGWRWQSTGSMVCNRATQRSWVLKLAPVVEREESWEAGWLAGFFDGEGSVAGGSGWHLSVCQNPGEALERAHGLLVARRFAVTRSDRRGKASTLTVTGGMRELLRFLMLCRPERLINNTVARMSDASLYGRSHQAVGLVKKEFLGDVETLAISTDTRTFVAEGLASHNCNFWRSVAIDPEAVAHAADWPVAELDLSARHAYLVKRTPWLVDRLQGEPSFCDPMLAGWWVWGQCAWIGTGWCSGKGPWVESGGELVATEELARELPPHLGDGGRGINRQIPHLGNGGAGINRKLPHLGDGGRLPGMSARGMALVAWFRELQDRLRDARFPCGDWRRVLTPVVTFRHGLTAVFLDPPYDTGEMSYSGGNGCATEVGAWCLENGANAALRIALCGHEGDYDLPGWSVHRWKASGGYGNSGGDDAEDNRHRETVWFSPACLGKIQGMLFA